MSVRAPRQRDWPIFDLLPEWMDEAACRNAPHDWWFPNRGEDGWKAKKVCWQQCSVRQQCLDYAITTPQQKYGIWGGLTESQRRRVRRERAA